LEECEGEQISCFSEKDKKKKQEEKEKGWSDLVPESKMCLHSETEYFEYL